MKKGLRQAFEFDGNFYTVTGKGFDLAAISLFWLVGWIIKLSLYLTFRHLPVSVLVLLLFAFSYVMLLRIPILFLIAPGASALVSSFLIDPLLDRHMPKEESPEETRQ